MGKAYKKKTSRKKPTCGGKKKRFSRRKMKGGVAFNTSFSTSSLPSSSYIPLNPNVNDNPSWNQYAGRLLPEVVIKGGKRTRKKRGGIFGRQMLSDDFKRRNKRYIFNKLGYETAGQKAEKAAEAAEAAEIERKKKEHNEEIEDELKNNYLEVDGKFLYKTAEKDKDNVKDIVFYEKGYNYNTYLAEIKELGTIVGNKSNTYGNNNPNSIFGNDYNLLFSKNDNINEERAYSDGDQADSRLKVFYFKKNGDKENALRELYENSKKGGKKTRKSRRKRKMKGGSLVSTDLVTGVSTSETNDVLAFGTSGGSVYMLDKLTGEPINSGPYMNPITEPQPPMA